MGALGDPSPLERSRKVTMLVDVERAAVREGNGVVVTGDATRTRPKGGPRAHADLHRGLVDPPHLFFRGWRQIAHGRGGIRSELAEHGNATPIN